MPTIFVSGDMLHDSSLDGISHGCNCAGAMGSGIALEFKQRFPDMFMEYRDRCKKGTFQLGDVFVWEGEKQIVFNLGTQKTWGRCASLAAIETSVAKMLSIAEKRNLARVGAPRIGAGLGGLKWEDVKKLFEQIGKKSSVKFIVFEKFIPVKVKNKNSS